MITKNAPTYGILNLDDRLNQVNTADTFLWNNKAFSAGIDVEGHGIYDAVSVNNMYLGMMFAKYYGNGIASNIIIT